ncbi:DNA gyrase subunit A [Candidatus Poribacteria bacterium]|nr:DNA gyrase subunit A [Candidatus Poribacteria bacterium]
MAISPPPTIDDSTERILTRYIEDELRDSYLTYAMSVNTNRAIPDVRDGLKPSSRRILYAMYEEGLTSDRPYDKCAAVVGEVMKNFHPHGDGPIYQTLVGMAQDFSMRYPLLDGQGNFGSIDDDPPGAMRYTEVRLSRLSNEMLADIDRDTVDFQPNYKESTTEPTVLPARLPNLIVNGTTGIGVGYLTRIPPHNLGEVVDALVHLVDHPDATLDALMAFIPAPDFPTGGVIVGRDGVREAFGTGRGSITMRARTTIEPVKDREQIIVTEIPYQIKKNALLEKMAHCVNEKTITGISDIRDESDREIRIVIELKRGEVTQVVLNQLFKHTPLQTTFNVLSLCLVDGQPRELSLPDMLYHYVEHRREVIRRRTAYDLRRGEERLHVLEGYRNALSHIDEIIEIVQESSSPAEAREAIIDRFGFSEIQAVEILGLTLQRLTGLERQKINDEYTDLLVKVEEYRAILESDLLVRNIIKEELLVLKETYADSRRTSIIAHEGDLRMEDLIADEQMVITLSHSGYIKRIPQDTYHRQRRGGVGIKGVESREDDFVSDMFIASNHQYILIFTNTGRCYWLKVYEIPEASRQARGRALVNLLSLNDEESIAAVVPVHEFDETRTLLFATRAGIVKRCALDDFSRPLSTGIIAQSLRDGDVLMDVRILEPEDQIIMVTEQGMSIRFSQDDVRVMGRTAQGVRGITLNDGDAVAGVAAVVPDTKVDDATLLVVTENGYGKRTDIDEYRLQNRGGKGIITIKTNRRNGKVVGARLVSPDDEIMVINTNGLITRMSVRDMRVIGRNTQGVKIMSLREGEHIQAIARIQEDAESEVQGDANGNGAGGSNESSES